MSGVKGCQVRIAVDGLDLSTQSTAATLNFNVTAVDYNTFQVCSTQRFPILSDGVLDHTGLFTAPDPGYLEREMQSRLGSDTDSIVSLILGTSLPIPVAYSLKAAWNAQLKLEAPITQLITAQGKWLLRNVEMYRLYQAYYGPASATGGLAYIDVGSFSGKNGKLILHVLGITGTATNASVIIETSNATNFSSPTTLGTFTFSAVGAQSAVFTNKSGRYIRANVSSLGGATALSLLALAGVQTVTYS